MLGSGKKTLEKGKRRAYRTFPEGRRRTGEVTRGSEKVSFRHPAYRRSGGASFSEANSSAD